MNNHNTQYTKTSMCDGFPIWKCLCVMGFLFGKVYVRWFSDLEMSMCDGPIWKCEMFVYIVSQ